MRTVAVKLELLVSAYIANAARAKRDTEDLRREIDRLDKTSAGFGKTGLVGVLTALPGLASAGAAGMMALPAVALSGAAAFGALKLATAGVGGAMTAVAEGDAAKLDKAIAGLSEEARIFVREYARVKPVLDQIGDATQNAFWLQLNGALATLTDAHLPTLLNQLPRLASELGKAGAEYATWASAPDVVARVNRQVGLAIDLTDDWTRLLIAGTNILLSLADAGREFTKDTVGGLADGAEAMDRWVSAARAQGDLNQLFDNGNQILDRLGDLAAEAGDLLFDAVANPALAEGALRLLDVLGITLEVIHGLVNAFGMLPGPLQTTVATVAVLGGAFLILASRVAAAKLAFDRMKLSAIEAGGAAKGISGMLGGPWGIAILAATVVLSGFAAEQAGAKQRVSELSGSLDEQTGAVTANTRAVVAARLEADRTLQTFARWGVTGDRVVDAVLGDAAAMDELTAAFAAHRSEISEESLPAYDALIPALQAYAADVEKAKTGTDREREATQGSTQSIREKITSLQELGDVLRAQNDPVFALIKTQRDLTTAQQDYDKAVRDHGKTSAEAREASLRLAELSIALAGNVGDLGETFDGKLSPAMRATLEAAGLTAQQIRDVEKSFVDAKAAGDKFGTLYEAKVITDAEQAKRELDAVIAKTLALKDKSIRIDARVYWTESGDLHVPGGTLTRRWGGVTEHAQTGLLRDATIYSAVSSGARYAFAERQTGGEAFVPRFGDYGKSMKILSHAARWYGASVVPQAGRGGGGAGGGNSYSNTYNIYPLNSNLGANELRAITAEVDAYDRAGRTR